MKINGQVAKTKLAGGVRHVNVTRDQVVATGPQPEYEGDGLSSDIRLARSPAATS
jgi:hypothetical protein